MKIYSTILVVLLFFNIVASQAQSKKPVIKKFDTEKAAISFFKGYIKGSITASKELGLKIKEIERKNGYRIFAISTEKSRWYAGITRNKLKVIIVRKSPGINEIKKIFRNH